MALLAVHESCGWALAWSDSVGGAFSPGPYAMLGVMLALLFVGVRLLLWLVVLPGMLASLALALYRRFAETVVMSRGESG